VATAPAAAAPAAPGATNASAPEAANLPAPAPGTPNAPAPGGTAGAAAAAPPPPSPEELKAQRERAALAEVDKLLEGGTEKLPALEKLLARWQQGGKDGKDTAAAPAQAHARASLLGLARADLEKQDFEAATAHYRIGSGLPGPSEDTKALLDLIRTSAIDAIKAGDADKAVAWAREGLALAGPNDGDSHALLADTLYASKAYKDAVDEYRLAIAAQPDDAVLKRGLDRARKKLGAEKAPRPRAKTARAGKAAASSEAPAESDADSAEKAAPAPASAPAEPAADE
jgi:hypothetical protein